MNVASLASIPTVKWSIGEHFLKNRKEEIMDPRQMKKLDDTHVGIANINFLCNSRGLWLSSVSRKTDGTELSAIGYLEFFGSKS